MAFGASGRGLSTTSTPPEPCISLVARSHVKKVAVPDAWGFQAQRLGEGHEAFIGVVIHARTGDDVIIASDDDIIPEREKTLVVGDFPQLACTSRTSSSGLLAEPSPSA